MDIKYEALNRGLFKHTTNPGLIKEVSLLNYLPKCPNRTRLVKEVAYCLVTSIEERVNRKEYKIAYYSCSNTDWKYKVVYPKVKYFKSLNDLIIVNIAILENNSNILFTEYEWFKEDLIKELKNYGE